MSQPSADHSIAQLQREYEQIAQMAGGLAHELRNPLSTISLNLEILREELKGEDSPRDRRMQVRVDAIRKECLRLEELLNEFLRFARGLELSPEPTDLSASVAEFIRFQQPQTTAQQVEIRQHLATGLPAVAIDHQQFRCVLLNLTLNALQAMPDGGTLEFMTYQQGDHVCLELIDSGCGISDKHRDKIFNLFYSTKPSGSGLGLPTVRKIIEAHHGTITCDSAPNHGTRFCIRLPIAQA